MEVSDAELMTAEPAEEVIGSVQKMIEDGAFDRARGKPPTVRPPPIEASVSVWDVLAKGRADLVQRISKSVGRKDRPLTFDQDVPLELIQNVAELIANRKLLPDANELRASILCFLTAFDPDSYVGKKEVQEAGEEALWRIFHAEISTANPKLAKSLSRQRQLLLPEVEPIELDLDALKAR